MSQFNEPARPADGPQFQQPQPGAGPQPLHGGQPPQSPPAYAPGPAPQSPKKRRWFLSWPVVAPVAFLLGLLIGTAAEQPAGSAAPAPTVTVTAPAENAPPGTASAAPADQPQQHSTTEPHGPITEPDQQPVGSPAIGDTHTTASGNTMTVTAESVVGGEWDDTADDGTYLLITVKLTNKLTEPVQPDMQVAVASGEGGAVAQEGYVDGVNGSWYYETIPAGASRTFAAAFVVSEEQATYLQITLTWSYVESITFTGSAGG